MLADVRDRERMLDVFREHRPEVVFHAAAHKHVPILEEHPQEALLTNVLGTANVVEAAALFGTERFVLISTDKAVRPDERDGRLEADGRGASSAGLAGRDTVLCAVRFGNVLGSRGSVVPTFLRQIAAGGPVTVTDPEMTRYFMSVEEAVQLVLQAVDARGAAARCSRSRWASPSTSWIWRSKLIRLSGRVPGRDIAVQVIGARPGEKQHEELVDDDEAPQPTGHPGIVVAKPPAARSRGASPATPRDGGARQGGSSRRARRAHARAAEPSRLRVTVRRGGGVVSVRAVVVAHREALAAEGIAAALARYPALVPVGRRDERGRDRATARRRRTRSRSTRASPGRIAAIGAHAQARPAGRDDRRARAERGRRGRHRGGVRRAGRAARDGARAGRPAASVACRRSPLAAARSRCCGWQRRAWWASRSPARWASVRRRWSSTRPRVQAARVYRTRRRPSR